jgi:stage V sporulation protein G
MKHTMKVTKVDVYPVEGLQKIKAYARVILDDQLQLTGLRIVDGPTGRYIAYPNNESGIKSGNFRNIFYPISEKLRDHITEIILNKYTNPNFIIPREDAFNLETIKETIQQKMFDLGYSSSDVSLGESLPGVYAEEFEADGKRFLVEYDTTETDEKGKPRLNVSDSDTEGNFATLYPESLEAVSQCLTLAMDEVETKH